MRRQEVGNGLERYFQPAQPERGVRPRIQADVGKFLVSEYDLALGAEPPGDLHIAR